MLNFRWRVGRLCWFVLMGVVFLSWAERAWSEVEVVDSGIKIIETDERWVKFSWKVEVASDKERSDCRLQLLFLDQDNYEVYSITEKGYIPKGNQRFTGRQMVSSKLYDQMKNLEVYFDCREDKEGRPDNALPPPKMKGI